VFNEIDDLVGNDRIAHGGGWIWSAKRLFINSHTPGGGISWYPKYHGGIGNELPALSCRDQAQTTDE